MRGGVRERVTATAGGLAGVVAIWWGLSLVLGPNLIPAPPTVAAVLGGLLVEGTIFRHASASLLRLVAGIGTAVLIGVPVGLLSGVSHRADRLISPVVYVLYPLPKIAFLPVFMVLFGLGDLSKIVLLVAVIFFQLVLAARDGVRDIPRELHYAAVTLRLNGPTRFRRLYLPSALPQVFSAVRISVGIGIAVLFLAENYATTYGMGYFIMNNWVMINYPRMFAGIVVLGVVAAAVLFGVDAIERRVCRWLHV
ncbi:MAG: ABC transporter permease [Alkalispirochaeta sp.]